ncbi:uncharacterized protein LOC122505418 isoform X2 [Leptopilina heterotoma]|uniref:uncharacterized protein LOC122505418 isoform X2 n=1 Tax=Leptopilina heterotoma TaxID=63436 RepID=UPI001CA88724|nr:uncharacterized protein LOC122505418 isoform X2 [Leptopilina heterotoma]
MIKGKKFSRKYELLILWCFQPENNLFVNPEHETSEAIDDENENREDFDAENENHEDFDAENENDEEMNRNQYDNLPEEDLIEMVKMQDLIPSTFNEHFHSDITTELFKEKELKKNDFCKIVRLIANKLVEAGKTNPTYILLASIVATQRFPGLRGNNTEVIHRRMQIRLAQCLKNKVQRAKEVCSKESEKEYCAISENELLETNVQLLLEESQKSKVDINRVKNLLTATRSERQKDAKSLPAEKLLEKYPILQDTNFLLWEFGELVGMSTNSMKKNLAIGIPKLVSILPDEDVTERVDLFLLEKVDSFFPNKNTKKGSQARRKLVTVLEGTNEESGATESPDANRAPFLIICGDSTKNVKCYVDAEPLFVETPLNAILLVIAAYWIFDISFDKHFQNQLILLSMVMFGNQAEKILGAHKIESISVNNLLIKAKLSSR